MTKIAAVRILGVADQPPRTWRPASAGAARLRRPSWAMRSGGRRAGPTRAAGPRSWPAAGAGRTARAAARALQRPHPGARVRRPVLSAGSPPAAGGGFDLVFANFADQRLYRRGDVRGGLGRDPPADAGHRSSHRGLRYADMVLSPDGREVWCVREAHAHACRGAIGGEGHAVTRAIVAVPLDGSAARRSGAVRDAGHRRRTSSPSRPRLRTGRALAWISWNHPRMPWDGTELRVGAGARTGRQASAGHGRPDESVLAPGLGRQRQPVRGLGLLRLVEPVRGAACRQAPPPAAVPARGGVRRAAVAAGRAVRSRCSATAGWRCCTARARPGWLPGPGDGRAHRG